MTTVSVENKNRDFNIQYQVLKDKKTEYQNYKCTIGVLGEEISSKDNIKTKATSVVTGTALGALLGNSAAKKYAIFDRSCYETLFGKISKANSIKREMAYEHYFPEYGKKYGYADFDSSFGPAKYTHDAKKFGRTLRKFQSTGKIFGGILGGIVGLLVAAEISYNTKKSEKHNEVIQAEQKLINIMNWDIN